MGERAERLVEERLRAALPEGARLYANVRFVAKTRERGPAHDGEADIVIVHPDYGLLVIEVKSGTPSLSRGTWYLGDRKLDRSPFAQAESAKHDLRRAIEDLPDWPSGRELRTGHAVAFPDVDLASLPKGHTLLGPDAKLDLVFDADAFATPEATRRALGRVRDWWVADGSRAFPLTPAELVLVNDFLAPTVELRRLLRQDLEEGRTQLLVASRAQQLVLNQNKSKVRAEVVGPAGSGKSLIAVEKACRLARDGFRTLYVCFNQPLATAVLREVEERGEPPDRRPDVMTFHRLCEVLGQRVGVLAERPPKPIPQAWWDETLPTTLVRAIDADDDIRYHAIVVDEGQDFRLGWLETLSFLLFEPEHGVFWVFHDPGQALRRDDEVAGLGLGEPLELFEDYRSPTPVSALAARFYRGSGEPIALGTGDRTPEIREAMPGAATVELVRTTLHRLLGEEGVRPWQVVVLSGQSASKSDVWKQRRFGNVELWNGAIDDDGNSLGLPADEVPDEPKDSGIVLFESVARFKGLERPIVILCELPEEGERLDQLLYTAFTRATTHLIVIASPSLAERLRRPAPGS